MFAEYFLAAERHLRSIGKAPSVQIGRPVTGKRLNEVNGIMGGPIPSELRTFFLEMGDGYIFSPDEDQMGFRGSWLDDFRPGFSGALRQEASPEKCRVHPPDVVTCELARRERWLPFYNFGGGGYLFCLDLNKSPAPITYYERVYWPNDPVEQWGFILADSLPDMVRQWSRFCFADTLDGTLIACASGATGHFDWSPSHFDSIYDRGTTHAEPDVGDNSAALRASP